MNDRKLKQRYLRDEIINKGFSPENFEDFCAGLRPDGSGTDLDTWTFEEIKIVKIKYLKKLFLDCKRLYRKLITLIIALIIILSITNTVVTLA